MVGKSRNWGLEHRYELDGRRPAQRAIGHSLFGHLQYDGHFPVSQYGGQRHCVHHHRQPHVHIDSGASFTFIDVGTGTLTVGTVFTVINNTSASPIAGAFSNLTDGSIFTSNGNTFLVSYEGGTGNDLTLTVQ